MPTHNAVSILFKAFIDSFRPRMLALTLVSVALAAVFWIVVIWFSINPLVSGAMGLLSWLGLDFSAEVIQADQGMLNWLKFILVPLVVFSLLWPMVATSAVLLAGLYVTPPVVRFLAGKEFSSLQRKGNSGIFRNLWSTLKAVLVFILAWIVTLPLWLIPGVAFILPIVLTAYLLIAVMRFDALADHASIQEIEQIRQNDSTSAWLIGLVCAFLSFIPPILLIMPVMSALAFTRYYLEALENQRKFESTRGVLIDSK